MVIVEWVETKFYLYNNKIVDQLNAKGAIDLTNWAGRMSVWLWSPLRKGDLTESYLSIIMAFFRLFFCYEFNNYKIKRFKNEVRLNMFCQLCPFEEE